jgi:hypothetical protein
LAAAWWRLADKADRPVAPSVIDYHSEAAVRQSFIDRGDQVARAKRTDRSEARRQYRAFLQAQAEAKAAAEAAAEAAASEPDEAEPAPTARRWRFPGARGSTSSADSSARSAAASGARDVRSRPASPAAGSGATGTAPVGFFKAMGAAYHQIHYREDLRYLPTLVTRTHAVWPSVLLAVVAGAILIFDDNPNDLLVGLASLVLPYPLVSAMLVGILAPRAAWMAGVIAGVTGGLATWAVIAVATSRFEELQKLSGADLTAIAAQYMIVSVSFGALMGALAAWYKRFLQLVMGSNNRRSSSSKTRAKRPVHHGQTSRR